MQEGNGFLSRASGTHSGARNFQCDQRHSGEKTMKTRKLVLITAVSLMAALAVTVQLAAQDKQGPSQYHQYQLLDLGPFDGPQNYLNIPDASYARILNYLGTLAAWADTKKLDSYPNLIIASIQTARFRSHSNEAVPFHSNDHDRFRL